MIFVPNKKINLSQLRDEARAAGAILNTVELGIFGQFVFRYDANGNPVPFDNEAAMQAVIDKHVAMRPLTDEELNIAYAQANDAGDRATAERIISMARGLIPRDTVVA